MKTGRTHRSFVSYIDKSREFYAAHGYERPYAWAHHDEVPFKRLDKPLSESRLGIVTSADRAVREASRDTKLYAAPTTEWNTLHTDKSWDKEATHTDDPETYLPVTRLTEAAERGRIGSLSARFYGAATEFSQARTVNEDAPRIETWMREDGVEAALLFPL